MQTLNRSVNQTEHIWATKMKFTFLSPQFPVSVHHRTASPLQLGEVERGEHAGRWETAETVHHTTASKTVSISLPCQAPLNHPSLKQTAQGLSHPFLEVTESEFILLKDASECIYWCIIINTLQNYIVVTVLPNHLTFVAYPWSYAVFFPLLEVS